jgi:ABC-type multidrug transport system ATPase subunit
MIDQSSKSFKFFQLENDKKNMKKIIELKGIKKFYEKKCVLDNVSFSVEEGSFTTLIGCNGAGKSTTLRLIAGNEPIDGGQIHTLGLDPYEFNFPFRPEVFFIHENYQLSFPVNLLEMVKHYRQVFSHWSDDVFNQILKDRKFSIKRNFSDLSRGQRMQFLLMMALAAHPKLMLLDEITSVIDVDGQRYFLERLKDYTKQGGSIVVTTNILSEMDAYTDHLVLLQNSKLFVDAKSEEIRKKFYLLKNVEEYPYFDSKKIFKIKRNQLGQSIYIASRSDIDEDTKLHQYIISEVPNLEDILIYHFKLEEKEFHEALVG